jgi:hypothetical protein
MHQAQVAGPAQGQQILQFVSAQSGPKDDVVGLDTQGTPATLRILAAIAVSTAD